MLYLAEEFGLGANQKRIAEVIALFHDIGRFEQFVRYRTYNDVKTVNHCLLGLEVLRRTKVLDGVEAFVNGGPMRGTRADAGVILAGSDRVAIDAAGVAILRLLGTTPEVSRGPVFGQEQLARAVELGLGIQSPAQIQFVTDDTESEDFARRVEDILLEG